MNDKKTMDLYELLPALYRLRDAEQGYPLRAFLGIVTDQVDILKRNVDGLWDDFFVETCADWVIPYIGDLVGNNPLYEVVGRRRADVANTIYYRRRKGTLPMLEELARDVTGWSARAVQFFELLGWAQNLNHLRYRVSPNPAGRNPEAMDHVGTVNLRNLEALDRLDSPFDAIAHTVDVRPMCRTHGWHNIRKVGFFLWRLRPYPMAGVVPRESGSCKYGYHFGSLGNSIPLFNNPERETDEAGLAGEIHVPGPIRPLAFALDLERYRMDLAAGRACRSDYYGPDGSLAIQKDGVDLRPESIVCKNLEDWARPPKELLYKDTKGDDFPIEVEAAVDVRLGRITFAEKKEPKKSLVVRYNYGFSADIGGGPYSRSSTLSEPTVTTRKIVVNKGNRKRDTIQKALKEWGKNGHPPCIIQITDNGVYGGNLDIELPNGSWLAIEAADGMRPSVRLVGVSSLKLPLEASGKQATLTLNGLLIEGSLELGGGLDLRIRHCTLVPGQTLREDGKPAFPDRDSLVIGEIAPGDLAVTIDHSIVGPIRLPTVAKHLTIRDSIVDAPAVKGQARPAIAADDTGDKPGPPTTLERVTIWGEVHVQELTLASEVIFTSLVTAQRQQTGCVRFSYVPQDSQTPRRYRCQPDLALEGVARASERARIQERLTPAFTSVHYGDPGYAQLGLTCAEEICTGAEDGSEMGVFCSLKQPQREANLRIRLEEHLPFGLEAGLVYVT